MANYTQKERQQIVSALKHAKKRLAWDEDLSGNKKLFNLLCSLLRSGY